MAQVSVGNYPIPNSTGANVRADINENLDDLYSTSSGSTPPAAAGSATGQLWIDTSTTPDTLKVKTGSGTTSANYTTLGNIETNFGLAALASPTFTGNIGVPAGSSSSLPIRNAADTDTGIYFGATNELDILAGNTDVHTFTSTASEPKLPLRGTNGSNSAPSFSFSADTDLGLYRSAADTLSVTTGGTERASFDSSGLNIKGQLDLRLHDSDSSNYAAIQAPSTVSSNYTLTLPTTDGNADEVLKTDGSGNLSWTTSVTSATSATTATTATNAGVVRTSSGVNESTAAQIFGGRCKAWVNIEGDASTPSIRDDFGVDTLTDISSAVIQINFSTNFANNDYCFTAGCKASAGSGGGGRVICGFDEPAVGSFKFQMRNLSNSDEHVNYSCLAFFGD